MNELKVFENEEFGAIRTIEIEGEPWFLGRDIAQSLSYTNTQKAIRDHVDEEDKLTERIVLSGQNRDAIFINESGLYSLILSSRLPSARRFKRWVTGEVIPAIRKKGAYVSSSAVSDFFMDPHVVVSITEALMAEREKNEELSQKLAVMQPKADYFDQFIKADDCTTLRITAQEIGIPERDFVLFLLEHEYLYRDKSCKLMPYSEYTKRGYFTVRDYYRPDGGLDHYTLVTCRGKNHIRKLLEDRR